VALYQYFLQSSASPQHWATTGIIVFAVHTSAAPPSEHKHYDPTLPYQNHMIEQTICIS